VERSRARPGCGAEGSELLCAKAAASGGEGGSDGRAGVGGGAAAALATGLDASKENGVAALLRLKAIMEATDVGGPAEILDLDGLDLHIKNRLVALSGRVQKVKDGLEHLLDNGMDMSEIYLTRKLAFQGFTETLSRVDSNKDVSTDHDEKYVE